MFKPALTRALALLLALMAAAAPLSAFAQREANAPGGDTITLDLQFEGWAEPKTALVTARVGVVTGQTQSGLIQARMKAITEAASGYNDWRLSQLQPAAGGRGAALWQGFMETRMTPDELGAMEQSLARFQNDDKSASVSIERVDFTPTLGELQAVRATLRAQAYQQASRELQQLNAAFPEKQYRLLAITFGNQCEFITSPLSEILGDNVTFPHGALGTQRAGDPGHVTLTARIRFTSAPPGADPEGLETGDSDGEGMTFTTPDMPTLKLPGPPPLPGASAIPAPARTQ